MVEIALFFLTASFSVRCVTWFECIVTRTERNFTHVVTKKLCCGISVPPMMARKWWIVLSRVSREDPEIDRMDREESNWNEFETSALLSRIYPLIDISLLPSIVEIRFSTRMYSFQFFFSPPIFLSSFTFLFLSKMFFSLGRNGFDFYQSSNPRRNWSQRLCYIIRGKRMIEKSDIYKFNRIDLSITELNLEREEFSRFTRVILYDEPLRPINNSSISIESPIQAGWYQNIIRHAATTLLNNPHPPL